MSEDIFYTVREFSNLVKVHPNTVLKGIKEGRIQAFKIGKGSRSDYRILGTEIKRLCELDMTKLIKEIVQTEIAKIIENS